MEPRLSPPDAEIIARVLGGDREAFGLLVPRYNQRLFRVARSILRDGAEAEEAVQDSYLQAYLHLRQLQHPAMFGTWLTRIVIREAQGRREKFGRSRSDLVLDGTHAVDERANPADQFESLEARKLLETAIDGLGETYRQVFIMREVHGMSTLETADCLEIGEEAVKVRLHRAKDQLRTSLGPAFPAGQADAYVFLGESCRHLYERVMLRLANEVSL